MKKTLEFLPLSQKCGGVFSVNKKPVSGSNLLIVSGTEYLKKNREIAQKKWSGGKFKTDRLL